jgi:hypothetical protein
MVTCVHEAGHAVVALLLGQTVTAVTVRPRGRVLGRTFVLLTDDSPSLLDVMITQAGEVAERRYNRLHGRRGVALAVDDVLEARHAYLRVFRRGGSRRYARLRVVTRELVRSSWPAVIALAVVLQRQGRVVGCHRLRQVVAAALGRG